MAYISTGRKKLGDNRTSRRVRNVGGLHAYMTYAMPKRTESECYIRKEIAADKLLEYIAKHNKAHTHADGSIDPQEKLTVFHCVCYMIAKLIMERPLLNQYIAGHRYYQRDDVILSFVAKKRFEDHAEEVEMMLKTAPEYTIDDFARIIVGDVHQARTQKNDMKSDSIMNILEHLPRPIVSLFQRVLVTLDYFAILPKSLQDIEPYHASVLLSNLGSVGCDAVHHHLLNFGTCGIIATIGKLKKDYVINDEGDAQFATVLPFGITVDERIGDGFYFAKSLKLLEYYMENPEKMELPLSTPLQDDVEY